MSPPTLREISEQFGLDVLVAGAGLDKPVRWAHSTEMLEPAVYLRGGELVLTVGSQLEPIDAAGRFVRQLMARDCVGVGLGVGDHWNDVPGALVSACESDGLTLITLQPSVPFIKVTEWLADRRAKDAVIAEHRRGVGALLSSIAVGTSRPDALVEELRSSGITVENIRVFAFEASVGALIEELLGPTPHLLGESRMVAWLLLSAEQTPPARLGPHVQVRLSSLSELPRALESTASGLARRTTQPGLVDLLIKTATEEAHEGARDILRVIRSNEAHYDSQLEATLVAFFAVDCSVTRAARQLHLHPNSVRYRLAKIRDITGLDPLHFDGQLQLALALALKSE